MAVLLRVTEDGVVVRFTGSDRVWACRSGVYLPMSRVLGAREMSRRDAVSASPRVHLPGVSVPRMLRAGSFGVGERRQHVEQHQVAAVVPTRQRLHRHRSDPGAPPARRCRGGGRTPGCTSA